MGETETNEPSDKVQNEGMHELPDLLNAVLNEGYDGGIRSAGWAVKRDGKEVVISKYEKPPETGGSLEEVARFEVA